jgi:hypothetical protein
VSGALLSFHKPTLLTSKRIHDNAQRNPAIYEMAYQWTARVRPMTSKETRTGSILGKGNIASIYSIRF